MEKEKLPALGEIIGQMTSEIFRVKKKRFSEQSESKLSLVQYALLYTISNKKDDVIQQDMANYLGKDKSSILRLSDVLEEKELIKRVADPKDRRKNYLVITPKGEIVLEEYMKIDSQIIEELFNGLSQSEIDVFLQGCLFHKKKCTGIIVLFFYSNS